MFYQINAALVSIRHLLSNNQSRLITSKIKVFVYIIYVQYVCCVYLLCIYKYTHMHVYISEKYVVYI